MNIPTAEEFLLLKDSPNTGLFWNEILIEFAKLHVEAALKAASKNADTYYDHDEGSNFVNESTILNAYPLTNIK